MILGFFVHDSALTCRSTSGLKGPFNLIFRQSRSRPVPFLLRGILPGNVSDSTINGKSIHQMAILFPGKIQGVAGIPGPLEAVAANEMFRHDEPAVSLKNKDFDPVRPFSTEEKHCAFFQRADSGFHLDHGLERVDPLPEICAAGPQVDLPDSGGFPKHGISPGGLYSGPSQIHCCSGTGCNRRAEEACPMTGQNQHWTRWVHGQWKMPGLMAQTLL